ncbi:MAG: hypothetical protein GEU77_11065 [Deltaproteobacteria bacterium]|nr:hypothetical protein [Deltaproteobacteria bacterium]
MKSIAIAFKYLTIWNRYTRSQPDSGLVGTSVPYFPLVGLFFGLMLALIPRALENYLDTEILSIVLTALLIFVTGGLHLEALQNTFDAVPAGRIPTTTAQSSGAMGIIAILLVLLFKIKSIDILEVKLTPGLLLTPVLARWALIVFIYGSQRHAEGEARLIAQNVSFWHLLLTTFGTLALATYLLGRTGLWIGLCLSVLALVWRILLQKRNGVLTRDNFGAVIELSEALSFTLLASL